MEIAALIAFAALVISWVALPHKQAAPAQPEIHAATRQTASGGA